MKNIFTSIDIGSNSIKIVVCELHNNKLNLLGASSIKSKGIKRGIIVNPDEVAFALKESFNKIESMLGIDINKAIVSVPSYFAEFSFIKGTTAIINEEHIVTSNEVLEVLQVAMDSKLKASEEMVTILPIDFRIDDIEGIGNPLNQKGHDLSTRAIMITAPKKNIYSVVSVLESININVVDIMINGIGNMYALKTRDMNNSIGAIIDIGAETTTISIYNKSIIVKNSILGAGDNRCSLCGKAIDNDIAIKYNIDLVTAKKIKETFVLAVKKDASVTEFYETTNENGDDIKINQFEVSEFVINRLTNMFNIFKEELANLSGRDLDYIVFTGGVSEMNGFNQLVEEKFGKKASVGNIRVVGARNNIYSAAIGDIIYFINKLKLKGKEYSMISPKDSEDLSSAKKNNANVASDTMINKLAQYFFGE